MTPAKPTSPPLTEQGTSSRTLWIAAGLLALAVHAGGAALVWARAAPDEFEEALGAPALEVSLELASPKLEPTDLPAGPEAEASVATPAVVEQKAVVEQSELPQAVPTETDDPDRLVTRDKTPESKEKEPDIAAVQTNASNESVASEAAAPPSSEAVVEAPRSTAPVEGSGSTAQRVKAAWQRRLVSHLDKNKRYPAGSAQRGVEIIVAFALDRTGHVVSASIVQGSGDPAFDDAALAMLRRADPVPAPPPLVADEGLNFTVPVVFRAKAKP